MTMETFWPTQFTVMLTINSTDPKGKTEYVTVLLIEAFRPLQIFTRKKNGQHSLIVSATMF